MLAENDNMKKAIQVAEQEYNSLLDSLKEYERIKLLDRTRRGTIHAIKKGQINGGNPPLGYRYIPKDKNMVGRWEVNPDEAKTVQYIFDLYVNENMKGSQIAKCLNDESVPCRGAHPRRDRPLR